jgi:hypothetical protein
MAAPLSLTENFYGVSEYLQRKFQLEYVEAGKNLDKCEFSVVGNITSGYPVLPDTNFFRSGIRTVEMNQDVLITYTQNEQSTDIEIIGNPGSVIKARETVLQQYELVPVRVKWVYGTDGSSTRLPIRSDNLPRDEYYPQLTMPLAEYYRRYEESDSNILVLIGAPGTGKTSFIRGMLHHTRSDAVVSYNSDILESDQIFADFMSGEEKFMVLEDADAFLSSRSKSGNTVMHKFLNVGDGLLSTRGKKIVFSTNLPSTRDIDSALLRVGRCFDVLKFRGLTEQEAKRIAGPDFVSDHYPLTLAEVFGGSGDQDSRLGNRVGF